MIQDMKTTLTRLFTVMMLIMVSMVAQADVKVLFGEDGKELEPGKDGTITLSQKEVTGGTITITQEKPTDGKVRVNFNVAPASGYSYTDGNITLVAFYPLSSTRADNPAEDITVHSTLTLTPKDKSQTDTSKPRDYYVDIDEGLGLWVQKVKFQDSGRKDGDDPDPEPVDPDYSGFYYIASSGGPSSYAYSSSNRANNFYLCPATQCFYNPNNNTNFLTSDNGMPHLTTYKSFAHDAVSDAIWHVTSVTVSGTLYYRFYHLASEKYLTYNTGRSISNNPTRLIVHLEAAATPDEDNTLFIVTPSDGKFLIRPKNVTDETKALNVSSDNLDQTKPGTNKGGIQGTIGYYNITGTDVAASYWYFEKAKPEITFTADDKVELSFPSVTIRYTTDGTDPTSSSTEYDGSAFTPDASATCIKAKAFITGGTESDIAFEPVLSGSSRTYLFHNLGYQSTSQDGFFMQPGDVDNNSNITVTTSSLARPQMQWYFKAAGKDVGYNYFYIVNNTGDYYLYCNSNGGIYMKPSSDFNSASDEYKFRILMDASDGYRIVPKVKQTVWIYKNEGNNSTKAVGTSNNATNFECRWEIIPVLSHEMPAELRPSPFTPSNTTSTAYYKIGNVGDATKFIVPGTTNATTAADSESDEMKWFFLEPSADSSDDWLDYYYIVNAVSGKYLYFCGNETTIANTNAFKTQDYSSTDDDKYRFVVAKTTESASAAGGKYYIVPKVLKDLTYTNYSLVWRDNSNALKTNSNRADNARKWTFTSTSFNCHEPVIEWSASDGGYIITATEPDAKIYYMIGEGTLTPSTGTLYTGAISVAELSGTTATIRAIVARCNDESDKSPEASVTVSKVEIPVVTLTEDGKVQLTCETEGSRIYYEIGNTAESVNNPTTTNSTLYSGLIENAAGKYIKAIAVKEGWINSDVATSSQIVFSCATPVVRKNSATTFTIECSFPASGVTIRYNMGKNPTDPTSSTGTIYSGAVSFSVEDLPFTVKAIAVATNYNNSVVAEQELTKDLTPDTDGYYEIGNDDDFATFITMANGLAANGKYKITANIDATGSSAISTTFKGELKGIAKDDGTFPVISNLDHPIFNTIEDGLVKNVILQDVTISQVGNVGAIAGKASGYTRIYNCGILPSDNKFEASTQSSVKSTDGYCGGLIGWLKDDSRVINCFSYANITGGTDVAGIVGHNEALYSDENGSYGSTTEVSEGKYYRLKTAVVNCMFYGNITSGSNRWPVYGGAKMVNNTATGINNYDFYRAEASLGLADNNHYNCSFPAKEEYLTQYEYYRYLLNSNRELCGWWVGADNAPSGMATAQVQAVAKDASLIAKWVLDPSIAPYPILKSPGKYPSVINQSPEPATTATSAASGKRIDKSTKNWVDRASSSNTKMVNPKAAPETDGRILGTIKVNISNGSNSTVRYCAITAMDIDNNDFSYGKIQLPYYNSIFGNPAVQIDPTATDQEKANQWDSRYGGNYKDKVVVGWEITDVGGGTPGNFIKEDTEEVKAWESGFNFADRNCTDKDKERVFAQGGYYYVPYGVTEITITAKWADVRLILITMIIIMTAYLCHLLMVVPPMQLYHLLHQQELVQQNSVMERLSKQVLF